MPNHTPFVFTPLSRRQWLIGGATWAAASALPAAAQPKGQPIKLVVPFAPGGGNDVFARQMAQGLADRFGRNVVVENKPGAGGNIGTEQVVRAAPDGGTLLLGHTGTVSIYKGLKFNATTDLRPVAMFASSALLLVVPANSPVQNVAQLAAAMRGASKGLSYASSGAGTGGHLTGELFTHVLGTEAVHAPYRGTAPSLTDLAGGMVDFSFAVIPAAMALVRAGKLRALGITSAKRHSQMPEVPTIAESGVPELARFESSLSYGLLAPKDTPLDVVRQLGAEVLQVAAAPAFQAKLEVEGAEPQLGDTTAYAQKIREETAKWAAVIKTSGATV
jgi:tripartite-type tricarboxylate transporter receptor subunit TctC